jgi:hypothetical protein
VGVLHTFKIQKGGGHHGKKERKERQKRPGKENNKKESNSQEKRKKRRKRLEKEIEKSSVPKSMPQPSAPSSSKGEKSKMMLSYTISHEEVRFIYEKGAELLIIGTGHYGRVGLSDEATSYLKKHGCRVKLEATPEAMHTWNTADEKTIALFHVTC